MPRRSLLVLALAATACSRDPGSSSSPARADGSAGAAQVRIGYQKNGVLVIARQRAILEHQLAPRGIAVRWVEFAAGPPMLEAMNAGSVDLGQTGDVPPVFAQAARANVVYVAGEPSTNGQGILVRPGAGIRTLGDLRGKRVGFTKGSSAHNLVVLALDKAGLGYGDITPVYLSPPDGGAAFARGSIDAWAVWDPYFAIGQQHGGEVLSEGATLGQTYSFYLANREFATRNPRLVGDVIAGLGEAARWAESHRDQVAQALAEVTGVELAVQTVAAHRSSFAIGALTDAIITAQQVLADRFYRIGLIPRPIVVRDFVWLPPQS